MKIGLITPTGNRLKQIKLCALWMFNQVYEGKVLWVIVDDGEEQSTDFIKEYFVTKDNWEIQIIRPMPYWKEGENTQVRNLLKGVEEIEKQKDEIESVFIIEDDDFYAPLYLQFMCLGVFLYHVVGIAHTVYYNLEVKKYRIMQNDKHGSLFETGFNISFLPEFKKAIKSDRNIDFVFWGLIPEGKKKLYDLSFENRLSYGIKGMAGRKGIGVGHKKDWANKTMAKKPLKDFIGINAQLYNEN